VKRQVILMNVRDNVATALTDLKQGQEVNAALDDRSFTVVLQQDIEFGHKVALVEIAAGDEITKYGMPIGRALNPIHPGEWVHVHNCRSHHWGFHNEKYGLQA
jgi:hypothetical protein